MNNPSDTATANQPALSELSAQDRMHAAAPGAHEIKIGKRPAFVGGKDVEVFTMTMGVETIELLPLRRWGQLDIYKWRVRGILPGTPAGLEITFDHLKLLGQTVSYKDPEGSAKVEKLFAEWLALEQENLDLAKKKAQAKPAPVQPESGTAAEQQPMRFQVEVDTKGMVHVNCVQGKESLASIGLNPAGFQSLISQGFMRKPHALKTGALHDWVEIDGVLFSFEKGNDDSSKLTEALNTSYLPASGAGRGKQIIVFSNAASSTGFDIQFPAKIGGLTENRRRPLIEEALDLMQDPDHCGLLQKDLVVKLTRPTLIFKTKTPDGGEQYLRKCDENLVRVAEEEGEQKVIDLSQPVNYLHLSAVELTAVFNHPSINRHALAAPPGNPPASGGQRPTQAKPPTLGTQLPPDPASAALASRPATPASPGSPGVVAARAVSVPLPTPGQPEPLPTGRATMGGSVGVSELAPGNAPKTPSAQRSTGGEGSPALPAKGSIPVPNTWLKLILLKQPIRHDWLTCLLYDQVAARFGNSEEGTLPDGKCWLVTLEEASGGQPEDTPSKDVFLTESGTLGYASGPYVIRFEDGFTSIGRHAVAGEPEAAMLLKGAEVHLLAMGMDAADRFIFVVSEGYRTRFGVPEPGLAAELASVRKHGGVLTSVQELLQSTEPIRVMWTVPVEQSDSANPQVVESTAPAAAATS